MRTIEELRTPEQTKILHKMRSFYLDFPDGQTALAWLLSDLGWIERVTDEESRVLHNYALRLLDLLGVTDETNFYKLVESMRLHMGPNPDKRNVKDTEFDKIILDRAARKAREEERLKTPEGRRSDK